MIEFIKSLKCIRNSEEWIIFNNDKWFILSIIYKINQWFSQTYHSKCLYHIEWFWWNKWVYYKYLRDEIRNWDSYWIFEIIEIKMYLVYQSIKHLNKWIDFEIVWEIHKL